MKQIPTSSKVLENQLSHRFWSPISKHITYHGVFPFKVARCTYKYIRCQSANFRVISKSFNSETLKHQLTTRRLNPTFNTHREIFNPTRSLNLDKDKYPVAASNHQSSASPSTATHSATNLSPTIYPNPRSSHPLKPPTLPSTRQHPHNERPTPSIRLHRLPSTPSRPSQHPSRPSWGREPATKSNMDRTSGGGDYYGYQCCGARCC